MKCEKCSGTGHIMFEGPVQVSESAIMNFSYVKHCPECNGSGKIVETKFKTRRCYKCDGKGKIEVIELEKFNQIKNEKKGNLISNLLPIDWVSCPECGGFGHFGIPEELKKEIVHISNIELHNSIRHLISDYIGYGVDNNLKECVDEIIKLIKEYYKKMENKLFDKEFDDLVRKSYEEK